MAAQLAAEIAIAVAEMAAAERAFRAVIELIISAAMVRAIRTPGEILDRAMVPKSRRQKARFLPIHAKSDAVRRHWAELARTRPGRPRNAGEKDERDGFAHASVSAAVVSIGAHSFIDSACWRGRRTAKRDPSPSLLSTSTRPRCKSTAILTR